ncbi:MAG: DUF983 domain-containing protein [Proteobacteria bacterium]|nr:DUF983 domain-containing protein [Pseudomonadota bacterium]MBI3496548.1 DUF983 domain-containing protein [Pseudomonadota bacterium]
MNPAPPVSWVRAGLLCRCPRCGEGRLFHGLLKLRASCPVCSLDLSAQDTGDGPAVFVTFALGILVIPPVFFLEMRVEPPIWVHAVIWPPVIVGLAIGLLRPLKAMLIALQFRHRDLGA